MKQELIMMVIASAAICNVEAKTEREYMMEKERMLQERKISGLNPKEAAGSERGTAEPIAYVMRYGSSERYSNSPEMNNAILALQESELAQVVYERCACEVVEHKCSARLVEIAKDPMSLVAIATGNDYVATKDVKKNAVMIIAKSEDLQPKFSTLKKVSSDMREVMLDAMNEEQMSNLLVSDKVEQIGNLGSQMQSIEPVLEHLKDAKLLLKVAMEAKPEWIRSAAIKKIPAENLAEALKTASPEFRQQILANARDQKLVLAVVRSCPKVVDEKIAGKIKSREVADYLFDNVDFCDLKSRSDNEYGFLREYPKEFQAALIIQAIIKNLSEEKVQKLAADAEMRAKENTVAAVVFGDYYIGMPAADFFAISRVKGVNPNWSVRQNGNKIEMCTGVVISYFDFKQMDRAKIFKCEDKLVLNQIIHQCVKHQKGTATILDYASLIKHDVKVQKDWTGQSYEGKVFAEYDCTEFGVKIRYDQTKSRLYFLELK